jgi:hypothetical protein
MSSSSKIREYTLQAMSIRVDSIIHQTNLFHIQVKVLAKTGLKLAENAGLQNSGKASEV